MESDGERTPRVLEDSLIECGEPVIISAANFMGGMEFVFVPYSNGFKDLK